MACFSVSVRLLTRKALSGARRRRRSGLVGWVGLGMAVSVGGVCSAQQADSDSGEGKKQNSKRLRVLFIRHGESYNNTLCAISWEHFWKHRVPDPPLSNHGEIQAQAAADYLQKQPNVITPIDAIYTSPMTRALCTALPISKQLNLNPIIWEDIYEVGGCYGGPKPHFRGEGGLTRAEIKEKFPGYIIPEAIDDNGWYPKGLNKESHSHANSRSNSISQRLRDMAMKVDKDTTIAFVAHHDTIDLVMRDLLNISLHPEPGTVIKHYNCAFSCVDVKPAGPSVLLFANRSSHLPKDLVEWEKLGIV